VLVETLNHAQSIIVPMVLILSETAVTIPTSWWHSS